ncbi:MAG: YceI family protein [Acidimicrobiia bacterium]
MTAPPVETTSTSPVETTEPSTGEDSGAPVTYALTSESQAVFTIDEELRGQPKTVVATSTIVLGELLFDADDPGSIQLGAVLVNARDFTTDSGNRDRAIRGPILDADIFEFIEFEPTEIAGLDGAEGEVSFTVTGDLTIRDISNPVTFEVTAVLNADETISGTAIATVDRTDWDLDIPSAPGVANVSELVTLTVSFVAAPTA